MRKTILYILLTISLNSFSQSWTKKIGSNYVPNSSGAVQIWSGKIVGDSLICDKGKNLVIIGKDFDATWTYGFPYKSAALISQRADAYGVVFDTLNFWFATDHTPNQIPIISFFQDIDYNDHVFTKHEAQRLDVNGVETYEPRISHIVTYTNKQIGSNLTAEYSYFSVPTKQLTNVRHVGVGQTYTTIEAAQTASIAGDLIYVHTGTYTPAANYLNWTKANITIKAIGFVNLILTAGTSYGNYFNTGATSPIIEGIYFNTNKSYLFLSNETNLNITFNRCRLDATVAFGNAVKIPIININNCVINRPSLANTTGTLININNSYLKNVQFTSSGNSTFINSKFIHLTHVASSILIFGGGSPIIKGCKITTADMAIQFTGGNTNDSISMSYCTITNTEYALNPFYGYGANMKYKINLFNNIFSSSGVNSGTFVNVLNTPFDIENNIFISEGLTDLQQVLIAVDNTVDLSGWKYKNNYHKSKSNTGVVVSLAGEVHYANIMNNGEFSGNRIIGSLVDFPTVENNGQHGLLLTCGINNKICHNYISDCAWGFVIKTENQGYATNGFWSNISANNCVNLDIGGIQAFNIFNNTFYNNNSYSPMGFVCGIEFVVRSTTYDCWYQIVKNNIFYTNGIVGDFAAFDSRLGAGKGNVLEHNILYGGAYVIIDDLNYATLATAQAAGWCLNSTNANPNIISAIQPYPITPITTNAIDLGSPYNVGLDITTNWGDATHYPTIVTKNQGATWQMGAYVK